MQSGLGEDLLLLLFSGFRSHSDSSDQSHILVLLGWVGRKSDSWLLCSFNMCPQATLLKSQVLSEVPELQRTWMGPSLVCDLATGQGLRSFPPLAPLPHADHGHCICSQALLGFSENQKMAEILQELLQESWRWDWELRLKGQLCLSALPRA